MKIIYSNNIQSPFSFNELFIFKLHFNVFIVYQIQSSCPRSDEVLQLIFAFFKVTVLNRKVTKQLSLVVSNSNLRVAEYDEVVIICQHFGCFFLWLQIETNWVVDVEEKTAASFVITLWSEWQLSKSTEFLAVGEMNEEEKIGDSIDEFVLIVFASFEDGSASFNGFSWELLNIFSNELNFLFINFWIKNHRLC